MVQNIIYLSEMCISCVHLIGCAYSSESLRHMPILVYFTVVMKILLWLGAIVFHDFGI